MSAEQKTSKELKNLIDKIMEDLYKDRERDIISGRFGLFGKKKTLDAIGKEYNVTRERIRQLEKGITIRLQVRVEEGKIEGFDTYESSIAGALKSSGGICSVEAICTKIKEPNTPEAAAQVSFISLLSSQLTLVESSDNYTQSIILNSAYKSPAEALKEVDTIIKTLAEDKEPISISGFKAKHNLKQSEEEIESKLTVSSQSYQRKGLWGLRSWSSVNPRSIKDKIFIVLTEKKEPMHFSEIHEAILADKTLDQKEFTVQATHNELIRDPRYVLVGRGRYALKDWGHIEGTVEDVIVKVLTDAGQPLHRDEVIRGVLRYRQVRETTIVLNLQSKPRFKRVATATFDLAENVKE
jgi:predicted Zn-ribbon and HTH transcriptional regulator